MFERYTEAARRALFFARCEASQVGSIVIGAEHLLLALLRDESMEIHRILERGRLSLENVRRQIGPRVPPDQAPASPTVEIPFSAEAKRVLAYAAEEADRLLHNDIGTEHLLLGLLREEKGLAAAILNQHGLRIDGVRNDIVAARSATQSAPFPFDPWRPTIEASPNPLKIVASRRPPHTTSPVSRRTPLLSADRFTLRELLGWVHGVDARFIDVPADLDADRLYDLRYEVPTTQDWTTTGRLLQEGLERYMAITVSRATERTDLFVLSAVDGPSPGRRPHDDASGGGFSGAYTSFTTVALASSSDAAGLAPDWRERLHSIGPLSMSRTTMAELTQWLEEFVRRPVVDETGLTGVYDIEVQGELQGLEALQRALRDQLGLALTETQREVEKLIVHKRPS